MDLTALNRFLETITTMMIEYAPRIGLAVLVLWVGLRIIRRISKLAGKAIAKVGVSANLIPFINSLTSISLKLLLIFSVASIIGVDVSAFIAVLAAAGFAVGLALQGSLANFAAGIIILIFRPYKVGDWIEVEGAFGKVEGIQIFSTQIVSPGRKTLIIPNGQIIEGTVTNYSKKDCIRLELNVSMPYEESFPKVQKIILDVLNSVEKVKKEPPAEVGIQTYDSHNLILAIRPYVDPNDYWEVTFEVYALIKNAFHQHGIQMAYSEGVELGGIGD